MKINKIARLTVFALVGAAAPMAATAADISVSRCNFDAQSVHRPALWITVDGERTLYKVDENNLTRRIIYDDKRAEAFARGILGLTDAAVEVDVVDTCNGSGYRRTAGEAAQYVAPAAGGGPVVINISNN